MAIDLRRIAVAAVEAAFDQQDKQSDTHAKRRGLSPARAFLIGAALTTAGRLALSSRGQGLLQSLEGRLSAFEQEPEDEEEFEQPEDEEEEEPEAYEDEEYEEDDGQPEDYEEPEDDEEPEDHEEPEDYEDEEGWEDEEPDEEEADSPRRPKAGSRSRRRG